MFTDPKTTITVIVGALAYLINQFLGVVIPQEAIIGVVVFVIGLFAKDSTPKEPTV